MTQQHVDFAHAIKRHTYDHTKSQPGPRHADLVRITEVDAIARSDWTSSQTRELIQRLAQEFSL